MISGTHTEFTFKGSVYEVISTLECVVTFHLRRKGQVFRLWCCACFIVHCMISRETLQLLPSKVKVNWGREKGIKESGTVIIIEYSVVQKREWEAGPDFFSDLFFWGKTPFPDFQIFLWAVVSSFVWRRTDRLARHSSSSWKFSPTGDQSNQSQVHGRNQVHYR
jgi:hypothetical protein